MNQKDPKFWWHQGGTEEEMTLKPPENFESGEDERKGLVSGSLETKVIEGEHGRC